MNVIDSSVNSNIYKLYKQFETLPDEISSGNCEDFNFIKKKSEKIFIKVSQRLSCTRDAELENVFICFHETLKRIQEEFFKLGYKKKSCQFTRKIIKLSNFCGKISKNVQMILLFFGHHEKLKTPCTDPTILKIKSLDSVVPMELKMGLCLTFIHQGNKQNPTFYTREINEGYLSIKSKLENIFLENKDSQFNEFYNGEHLTYEPSGNKSVNLEKSAAGTFIVTRNILGKGRSKSVRLAINLQNNEIAALATSSIKKLKQRSKLSLFEAEERILNEIKFQKMFAGEPEFVQIFHVSYFHNKVGNPKIGIMMEYCNGDTLKRYLEYMTLKKRENKNFWNIIENCLNALVKMEDKRIQHRDIKPENIILYYDPNGEIRAKIADFGLARDVDEDNGDTGIAGTPFYYPPEAVIGEYYEIPEMVVNTKGDIWALGCIILNMRLGIDIHSDVEESWEKLHEKLLKLDEDDILKLFLNDKNRDGLRDLNIAMLDPNVRQRPSAKECLKMFLDVKATRE